MSNIRRRAGGAGGKETNSDSATMAQEHIHEHEQGHTSEHRAEEEEQQAAVPQEDVDKYRGPIGWCRKRIYQYELTTGLYMLDRWEKVLFNSVLIGIFGGLSYYGFQYIDSLAQNYP